MKNTIMEFLHGRTNLDGLVVKTSDPENRRQLEEVLQAIDDGVTKESAPQC